LFNEFKQLDFQEALTTVAENNNIDSKILKSILKSQGEEIE